MRVPGAGRIRAHLSRARVRRFRRSTAANRLLRGFARAYPRAVFIEIGSNDGMHHDHLAPLIRREDWRGVMVEPVPYVFERLRRNYGDVEGVTLENAAIADCDGELSFYHLAEASPDEEASVPGWYDGIGSFSREVVLAHGAEVPGIEDRLVQLKVRAMTFDSLNRRHGLDRLDLLVIDTEGYDWTLIQSIDLNVHHPRLLVYEHYHLPPTDRAECRNHLAAHGYETMEEGFDTLCLDTAPDDALTETWRNLSPRITGQSALDDKISRGEPSAQRR